MQLISWVLFLTYYPWSVLRFLYLRFDNSEVDGRRRSSGWWNFGRTAFLPCVGWIITNK